MSGADSASDLEIRKESILGISFCFSSIARTALSKITIFEEPSETNVIDTPDSVFTFMFGQK
jgi:hypothetical protein